MQSFDRDAALNMISSLRVVGTEFLVGHGALKGAGLLEVARRELGDLLVEWAGWDLARVIENTRIVPEDFPGLAPPSPLGEVLGKVLKADPVIGGVAFEGLEGVEIRGDLFLADVAVKRLPKDLKIHGDLDLQGLRAWESLPVNLEIYGDLNIENCPKWDGIVPEFAVIKGVIRCRAHPNGIKHYVWNSRYGGRSCWGVGGGA